MGPATASAAPTGSVAQNAENTNYNQFDAIVRVGNCSGSIIALPDSEPSDKALLLTNGHCYNNNFRPGDVVVGMPSRAKVLLFNGNSTYKVGSFYTTRALYSTTTGTDMTIYETSMTDQDLARRYGTTPRIVSETPVAVGEQVGVTSGYWKRTWDCTMTTNVDKLKEGDWTWNGAYRMEGPDCLTRSGSSGSPVLNSQGQIVAVNNTANFNGY